MDKKGVSLAFNTIIVGIIVLLVLVVIVYLLFSNVQNVRKGTDCTKEGGRCIDKNKCTTFEIEELQEDGSGLCEVGVCCSIVPG